MKARVYTKPKLFDIAINRLEELILKGMDKEYLDDSVYMILWLRRNAKPMEVEDE